MKKLLTDAQRETMLANGKASAKAMTKDGNTPDHYPVVKLFTPMAGATWLLTELDPDEPDIAFGLCDLGQGFPELGSVLISELESMDGMNMIERDLYFEADKPLSAYTEEAKQQSEIVA